MPHFDRFDIAEAYYVYSMEWGIADFARRLAGLKFKARPSLRGRKNLTENGKAIYRRIRLR